MICHDSQQIKLEFWCSPNDASLHLHDIPQFTWKNDGFIPSPHVMNVDDATFPVRASQADPIALHARLTTNADLSDQVMLVVTRCRLIDDEPTDLEDLQDDGKTTLERVREGPPNVIVDHGVRVQTRRTV